MMKAVIISIIARLVAFLGVLGFVFGIVYMTKNTKFLWLLLLLLAVDLVPTYETRTVKDLGNKVEIKQND